MLRWHLQQGRQVIPKSVTPSRIEENIDVLDFELTPEQLAAIDTLDTGYGPQIVGTVVGPAAAVTLRLDAAPSLG